VPALLDADGEALRLGLAGGPDVVKPNLEELERVTGTGDPWDGADRLRELGAGSVVVSLGADGLIALTGDGSWHARPAGREAGNPTGAGDAAAAALAGGSWTGSHGRAGSPTRSPCPPRPCGRRWRAASIRRPTAGSVPP
jgi:tagatose 6-phosphate kinase